MKRTLLNVCLAAVPLAAGGEGLPVPIVWQVNAKTLARRQYIKDIDYLRAHTAADILSPAPENRRIHSSTLPNIGWQFE